MKASEFFPKIMSLTGSKRENLILEEINKEHIPEFLKKFAEINVELNGNKLKYFVSKDYFALGENSDYILMPVFPNTIKSLLEEWNCSLPTTKMVDQIYHQATIKIPARPQKSLVGESSTATRMYVEIDKAIKKERVKLKADLDVLIAGHKKDVVLSNAILKQSKKNRMAIYGWWYSDGSIIQRLNPKDHDIFYVDYSHGFRLISNKCYLNNVETTLQNIWNEPMLCQLIHDEPLKFQSY